MAGKKKTATKGSIQDSLANLVNVINTHNKDQGVDVAHLMSNKPPVKDYVSTGNAILDLDISNLPHGGIPYGRITEITGLEGSGKSLLAAHVCANNQKKGGISVFIDTEHAAFIPFMQAIGVNIDELVYIDDLMTVESIYSTIEQIIVAMRENEHTKDLPLTIALDSLTAAYAAVEEGQEPGVKGYATHKARINSDSLKHIDALVARNNVALIITSQMRANMKAFGPMSSPYVSSSGGMALQFYASVRIQVTKMAQLTQQVMGVKRAIGVKAKAKTVKNRIAPPHRVSEFDIFYDSGVENYGSWAKVLKQYKVIKGTTSYEFVDQDGKNRKISAKTWSKELDADEGLREYLYGILANLIIAKYRNITEVDLTTVEIQEGDEGLEAVED